MSEYRRTTGAPPPELRPDFYMDTIKDELASHEAGRDIYREVERVRIIIPGAVATIVVKNVDDSHRHRWKQAYEAFRAGREQPISGFPLEEWPVLNRAQVAELRAIQIRTVEELATLSDLGAQQIGMGGQMLRQRAKAFMNDSERESLATKLYQENDQLRSRVSALENQVGELGRQLLIMTQQPVAREGHPFQVYVPGDNDPLQRPPGGHAMNLPLAPKAPSALDALFSLPQRPERAPAPEAPAPGQQAVGINFDPAAGANDP